MLCAGLFGEIFAAAIGMKEFSRHTLRFTRL
jgi:hypothetical protein